MRKIMLFQLIVMLFCSNLSIAQNQKLLKLNTTDSLHLTGIAIDHKNQIAYFGAPLKQEIVRYNLKTKKWRFIGTPFSKKLNPVGLHFKNDLLYVSMNQNTNKDQVSAFVVINTKSNKVIRQYETKPTNERNQFYHITLDTKGVAYISNIHKSAVYTVNTLDKTDSLKIFIQDKSLGWIHGIDISEDQTKLFVTGYVSGIQIIDLKTKTFLPLNQKVRSDNDQLKYYKGSLYGTGGNFFKKYTLNESETDILKTDTLIQNHAYFIDPRQFVIYNDAAHILTNNGFAPFDYRNGRFSRKDTLTDSYLLKYNLAKNDKSFTFKKGVSLNHWTGYPIDSFTYADPKWFNRKDVEWIANTGMDHIQLYITGTEIITQDEKIIPNKIVAIDSLIGWCNAEGLGVILSPARMPNTPTDSTLTREERVEKNLKKQAANFSVFANYFKNYGQNVRFLLNIETEEKALRNRYYQMILSEIRKTNPDRKLYITAYSINKLSEIEIPKEDENIIIAAEISQSTEPKAEAVDVFAWQYQDYFFTNKMPLITFPGSIPIIDTTMVTDLGKWAIPFSNTKIEQNYFDNKIKWASNQMKQYHPRQELYISHFRYWTGYPFDPKTVKDVKSVTNFISSFASAAKKNNINWCFYDYNSGSGIRNPNGEKAMILEALELDE